jgi:hypothetical protein
MADIFHLALNHSIFIRFRHEILFGNVSQLPVWKNLVKMAEIFKMAAVDFKVAIFLSNFDQIRQEFGKLSRK